MSRSKKESIGKNQESESPSRDSSFYQKILKDPFAVVDLYDQPDDDDLCEPLVRALEDPDDLIRRAAVRALIMLNDLYAASSIYGVVTHGSVPARRAAVEVLGRIGTGDSLAATHLINALSDSDPSVRECAAEALKKLGITIKKNTASD
jgi:HEAT repeat protein